MQRMTKCFGPNHLPQIEVRPTCADNQVDKSPCPHLSEEPHTQPVDSAPLVRPRRSSSFPCVELAPEFASACTQAHHCFIQAIF